MARQSICKPIALLGSCFAGQPTLPTPGIFRTGRGSIKRCMAAWSQPMANCPSGLRMSVAILDRSLFGPMPQEQVSLVSSLTLRLICSATASPAGRIYLSKN